MKSKRLKKTRVTALAITSVYMLAPPVLSDSIVDGASGAGDNLIDGTITVVGDSQNKTTYTGFYTEGGAGSGGGAGLGGVFFVNSGNTLNITNTDFKSNMVKGGEGGALPSVRIFDDQYVITGTKVDLIALDSSGVSPTYISDGSGGYTFTTLTVDTGTALLKKDSPLSFSELNSASAIIDTVVNDSAIILKSNVAVGSTDLVSFNKAVFTTDSSGNDTVTTAGFSLDGTGKVVTFKGDVTGNSNFTELAVGNTLMADSGGLGVKIVSIQYGSSGGVEGFTLDTAVTANTKLDVIPLNTFTTKQFYTENGGTTIKVTSDQTAFKVGMSITGDDVTTSRKITAVSNDGRTLTLDGALDSAATAFLATENPAVGDYQIDVSSSSATFSVGDKVFVPGDTESDPAFSGVVNSVVNGVLSVTADAGVTGTLASYYDDASGLSLTRRNLLSVSGSTITLNHASPADISSGMLITGSGINSDTTVSSVVNNGNGTVTLTLSDSVADASLVSSVNLKSPLSKGGAMNAMVATGNVGSDGNNGFSKNAAATFFNDGEGQDGTRGYGGDGGSTGTGFDGGNGGNGSNGTAINPTLVRDVFNSTKDFVSATGNLAGVLIPDGVPPIPQVGEIAAATLKLVGKSLGLADSIYRSTIWVKNMNKGLAGMGGEGGEGGEGGGGVEFFGGGAGGTGGTGGTGALAHTDGGNGGNGGRGGHGGFGAGGGNGGAGGDEGATGAADGGDEGEGGFAGFAAGEGSNGLGLFGGGGSGFGGAIFVRDGGALNISGNSLFENNVAQGGSSNNRGEAGDGVGTDLFMMKGANVTLSPGLGNTIEFKGSIADNSGSSYEGAEYAEGAGANITIAGAGGRVLFSGENSYSGDTILKGATLDAVIGEGIHSSSRIHFNGTGSVDGVTKLALGTTGTLLLGEDYTSRRTGTKAFETMWSGSGGFASGIAGGVLVNMGELDSTSGLGQELTWGSDGFFEADNNATLTFGSELSQGAVTFRNNVDLNNNIGRVAVYNTGDLNSSVATLSGNWSNGILHVGDKDTPYTGILYVTGQNDLDGFEFHGGVVSTYTSGENDFGKLMKSTANLIVDGTDVQLFATEDFESATISSTSNLKVFGQTSLTGALENNGEVLIDSNSTIAGRTSLTNGALLAGLINNNSNATFNQNANITVLGNTKNDGVWQVKNDRELSTDTLSGVGIFNLDANMNGVVTATDLSLNLASNSIFDGYMTGLGSLTKKGAGVLTLTNGQTFKAGLNINNGGVKTTVAGTFDANLAVNVSSGATFETNVADTIGSIENAGTTTLNSHITTTAGVVNTGGIVLNNDLTVGTTLTNNGSFNVDNDRAVNLGTGLEGTTGTINIADTKTLTLKQNGNTSYSGDIFGPGNFTVGAGTGTLTLNGDADSLNLGAGMLTVASDGKLALDGANILASTQAVTIENLGELELVAGGQSIKSLSGLGHVSLNTNVLEVENGGEFTGTVNGSGSLAINGGNFTVNNLESTSGEFKINDTAVTTIENSSTLKFPVIKVETGGKLEVEGTANSENVIVASGSEIHLGNSDGSSVGSVVATTTDIYGTLSGNGSLTGTTIVHAGAALSPGNSPGLINVEDLTLASGSTSDMEINKTGVAGIDFDQVVVTGNLNIEEGAVLNIIKFDFDAVELAMGEQVQVFNFEAGKVSGRFGSVNSDYTNEVIYNIATGTVVGTGGVSGYDAIRNAGTTTTNLASMLDSLNVSSAGGVKQFYGGKLISRLAKAVAVGGDTRAVYFKSSPEAYASLMDQSRLALIDSKITLPVDLSNNKQGVSLNYKYSRYGTDNDESWSSYSIDSNLIQLEYTVPVGDGVIVPMVSAATKGVNSKYLNSDSDGFILGVGGAYPLYKGFSVRARAKFMSMYGSSTRATNSTASTVDDLDTNGYLIGGGFGYHYKYNDIVFSSTVEAITYSVTVDSFDEENKSNKLDALHVNKQSDTGAAFLATISTGYQATDKLFVKAGANVMIGDSDDLDVTANVITESTTFNVVNPGMGKSLVSGDISVDYEINDAWSINFSGELARANNSENNYHTSAVVRYKF